MDILIWIVSALLVVVGLAGTLLPMLPGIPLVLGGLVLAAWSDHFQHVGWAVLAVLGVLTLLSLVVDFAASSVGAKRAGATRAAILGAAIGTTVGLFFALPGLLLGPFVGAALGQYIARRKVGEAARAGAGAWLGFIVGSLAKLALGVAMVGVFAVAWFV